ncbi:type II toxin-antitoxin system PemK/MazF family toxin [Sorangium sp. So ce394]|uniref:type II toxin-antitoxin system PemK/MazF family toxin n=1 Tax=Sorangium sp. So ce394 TaxID=3133310 RepID=UPI003F5C46D4
MGKLDLKAAAERASAVQSRTRPGAVYLILDEVLNWPDSRDKPRGHKHHRVILLQDEELCRPNRGPATIMVVPCSSTGVGAAAPWDFVLPEGESGFDKPRVVAYTSLVQPILKTDLNQYLGQVSKSTLTEIKARAQLVLSIQRMPIKLPDRPPAHSDEGDGVPADAAVDASPQPNVAAATPVTPTAATIESVAFFRSPNGEPPK